MSWFQSTNLASFAKTALKEAQKTIDKALDIAEEEDGANNSSSNSRTASSGRTTAAVSNAVQDMASEFFASWGVSGGGRASPSKTSSSISGDSSSNASASASSDTNENRAISTPPKRCATMNDLLLGNQQNSNSSSGSSNSSGFTSDVPVTLLASSDFEEQSGRNIDDNRAGKENSISSKHTRSLSDTVFHASDDSNNLGDLVQVLDDTSSVNVTSPQDHISYPQSHISIPKQQPNINIVEDTQASTDILSAPLQPSTGENETLLTHHEKDAILITQEAKSNIELLQEIDLNNGAMIGEASDEINFESNNVIPSTDPISSIVQSSGLSDGWDWTSTTDSCMVVADEGDASKNNQEDSTSEQVPVPDELEEPAADVELLGTSGTSEETLQPDDAHEETIEEHRDQLITTSAENTPSSDPAASRSSIPSPLPTSSVSPTLIPCPSSPAPAPSPTVQDPGGGGGESTPPSSARVSPNFEMVSSCVVNTSGAGSNLPESSRSSSIVVVSGRESTLNSRGTSGAGSSGSSEGGHDIVDGEAPVPPPHSPAAVSSSEFPITTKHKKAASSSSSSDIEVIPSDYSSSSSAPLHHLHGTSKLQNSSDMACQTDPGLQTRDCEAQTEENQADSSSVKPVDVDPKELSKYVSTEVADLLAEKDAEVQQLREEGEKLSIKQFELGQVIKKLRAKEKETENVTKGLRTEVATKNLELEKLMKTFISKEGIEQSQNETISKLNQERRKLELRVEQLNSELEDANDNVDSMKATVENASIEILELKNVISSVQRESAEVDRLTRDKGELISRTESLQKEVDHLRSALNSSQTSHHSREAELRSQISTLTQKVHHLETQLADISSEVADATMPLSLEIEKLQGELKQQLLQADRREQAMHSTIADLELKLKTASDRERSAKELQIQFQSQHSTLELRIEELEAENRTLVEQHQQKEEIFTKKIEDRAARCQKLEKTVERLTGEVERLSSENDALSNELKVERNSLEVERRRVSQSLLADGRENNNFQGQGVRANHHPHHQRSSSMSTTTSSTAGGGHHQNSQIRNTPRNDNSREHSPSEHSITSEEASYLDEVFDPNSGMLIGGNGNNRSMTPKSFFESFSSVGLIENLQGQLRLREAEVVAFQEELSKNEKIRKQLNEEIANLTMQNQQLALDMEKLGEMEQRLADLDKNYNAVLQMYGEKVEEADELRMDLEDVKEMYKAQIETLLKKS